MWYAFNRWLSSSDLANAPQYFCYPETTNLTLEEIDWLFYEGNVVKRSVRIAKDGWEESMTNGHRSLAVLESGSISSREKKNVTEQREN